MTQKDPAEKAIRDIRRKTRRKFSAEEKTRIVIEGLRGEESIASLCLREGIAANLYYRWSKEFLEAGKKRLLGDTQREANSSEVTELRKENARLKEVVAETILENRLLKKACRAPIFPRARRESECCREARADPIGRGVQPLGATDPEGDWTLALHVLRLA